LVKILNNIPDAQYLLIQQQVFVHYSKQSRIHVWIVICEFCGITLLSRIPNQQTCCHLLVF
jgi:hypothetical protein